MTRSLRGRLQLMLLAALAAVLVLALPVGWVLTRLLGTYVSRDFCPRDTGCRDQFASLWMFLPIAALVALVVWVRRPVVSWVLRPLSDLAATIDQLGPQNLGQRMALEQTDGDVRALALSVNAMLDRVAVGFEGQRRFASNASHELRTPLAVQRTLAEVAMVTGGGADVQRLAAQLLVVNERNEQLIEGLLVLAEVDRGLAGTIPVRLDELAETVVGRYSDKLAEHELTMQCNTAERTVPGDPVLVERLLVNLVDNAIKYNRPGGWVEVHVGDEPAVTVRNSGDQVPAEAVDTLFQPFRRLAADRLNHRDGAGLGLSIVNSIAAAHRGRVSASPENGGGLRVEVVLP
jgi:signal transduction histidine kinase